MQQEIFQKLVAKLDCHCEIILIGSEIDYRRYIAQRSKDNVQLRSFFKKKFLCFDAIIYAINVLCAVKFLMHDYFYYHGVETFMN